LGENNKKFHQTTVGKWTIATVLSTIVAATVLFGFVNNYIDGRITNHPDVRKITELSNQIESLKRSNQELIVKLEKTNETMTDLRIELVRQKK